MVMRGQDLRNFCRDLLSHLRDLLVAKVAGDSDELLESSAFDYTELKRQAANFNESDLVRFFHSLSETETSLKTASNARYQLEIGLVKLMEMRKLAPLSQILERLNQLEETLRTGKTIESSSENISIENAPKINKPTPSNVPTVSSSSKSPSASIMSFPTSQTHSSATAAAPALEEVPFEDVGGTAEQEFTLAPPVIEMPAQPQTTTQTEMPKENFYKPVHADNSILGRIKTGLEKRKKHLLAVAIDNIARAKTDDNEISFDIAPEDKRTRETFNKPDNMKLLREVACEVLGKQVGIRFASVEQNGDTPQSQEDSTRNKREALRQEVENHPLVQKTLNIFQGEIIEFSSKD
jgi:DNA polymerase-3 subunit gamma/tau